MDRSKTIIQCTEISRNRVDNNRDHGHLLVTHLPCSVPGKTIRPSKLQAAAQIQNILHGGDIQKYLFASAFRSDIADAENLMRIGDLFIVVIMPVNDVSKP
jgi:hypothetical protein